MKKVLIIVLAAIITVMLVIFGFCLKKGKDRREEVFEALNKMDSVQKNFSEGNAMLLELPINYVQAVYDYYDELKEDDVQHLPIQIREYAVTGIVYFDYDTDVSIVWDKMKNTVSVRYTDVNERDSFMQKEHK